MNRLEKLTVEILRKPTRMSFADVRSLLEAHGWTEHHSTRGSHVAFKKQGEFPITLATVQGRWVKATYLAEIIKRLGLKEED